MDAVFVPIGGGGLVSGIASAVEALSPGTRVVTVRAGDGRAARASLAAGGPVRSSTCRRSWTAPAARVLLGPMWPRGAELVDGALVVTLEETAAAVRLLAERARVSPRARGRWRWPPR